MSISKLLAESNKWLKDAEKAVIIKRAPDKPETLFKDFAAKREGEIKARIGALEKQRDAAVKRYDLAIDEQKKELERLKKELAPPKPPAKDKKAPRPTPRRRNKPD